MRKSVFGISDKARNKPGCTCTSTEDSQRLKISDLESRVIVLLHIESKGTDQLPCDCEADLRLLFLHMHKSGFLMMQLLW